MTSNIEKYKNDILQLIKMGKVIFKKMKDNKHLAQLRQAYEMWYSESYATIKIILPDRISDFSKMYYDDKKKEGLKTYFQYTPSTIIKGNNFDFLDIGDTVVPPKKIDIAKSVFDSQIGILKSCERRFESSLFDIKQLLRADIFGSELEAARELNKKGFTRGAGAVAGVVLEGHLMQVCSNHKITVKKNNPTINDLNQSLKDSGIIETPTWRSIQRLGDLRNLCDHKKQKEPTKEEIEELIQGVEKISKTLY
jgi:hypothetical protein